MDTRQQCSKNPCGDALEYCRSCDVKIKPAEALKRLAGATTILYPHVTIDNLLPCFKKLIRFYVYCRCMGTSLSHRTYCIDSVLFSSLHEWWGHMQEKDKNKITSILLGSHVYVLKKRNVLLRSEFAFLVSILKSLEWAKPYMEYYVKSNTISCLRELFSKVQKENDILTLFFGDESTAKKYENCRLKWVQYWDEADAPEGTPPQYCFAIPHKDSRIFSISDKNHFV